MAVKIGGTYERFDGTRFSLAHTTLDEHVANIAARLTNLECSPKYIATIVALYETSKKIS